MMEPDSDTDEAAARLEASIAAGWVQPRVRDLHGEGWMSSAERQARDLLKRTGVLEVQSFSSGDLVELANLIDHAGQDAQDARCFRFLQSLDRNKAQAYFWNYASSRDRAKAINDAIKKGDK